MPLDSDVLAVSQGLDIVAGGGAAFGPGSAELGAYARLIGLVVERAPLLRLHPDDVYRPASVDYYLPRVALGIYDRPTGTPDKILKSLDVGEVTTPVLLSQHRLGQWSSSTSPGVGTRTDFRLYNRGAPRPGGFNLGGLTWKEFKEATRRGALKTARYYAHVRAAPGAPGSTDVQYWFFYPYNGRLGTPPFHGLHEADWEHVTVRVAPDGDLLEMYFSAHHGEGGWYPHDGQTLQVSGTHPIAYSAWHSHASYPAAGRIKRAFPRPDDETADGGPEVKVAHRVDLVAIDGRPLKGFEWLFYAGGWGRTHDAPHGPAFQGSWASDK